ncbi:hypothetical protein EVJ24_14895 [Exiguobacterium sp. SH1S21]|uniref:PBECR4 domain-containing protein n=1 Tax=Exiguobacterium sp. SH1S21 TaxID=2510953 RepID=UPI00103E1140|nr:PBECR4 domain-containing protein [Exiguobacterium sp. SH1S21]TCI50326.1 hypothetical protein EVJ24_14895 [Exiguobacterium sp. SH1S21]
MYTVDFFRNFTQFQDIEEMDLHQFILFFDREIVNRRYTYINSQGKIKSIKIEFRRDNFPHLIGLQYWNNLPTKQATKQYDFLLSGKWDFEYLKKADKKSFEEFKKRFELLPFFYQMFYEWKCEIKLTQKESNRGFKSRGVDMVFRKDNSDTSYLLELRQTGPDKFTYKPVSISDHILNSSSMQAKYLPLRITDVLIEEI